MLFVICPLFASVAVRECFSPFTAFISNIMEYHSLHDTCKLWYSLIFEMTAVTATLLDAIRKASVTVRESISPLYSRKNANRKDAYIVNSPDLIEPFPPKFSLPPPEYILPENSVWCMVICVRERIRTEQINDTL